MEDGRIIELFFNRSEEGICEAETKYGKLCRSIARRILPDERDAEECLSDVWIRIWNAIPPHRPKALGAYLAKVTRNAALDKLDYNAARCRASDLEVAFEELESCLCRGEGERTVDSLALKDAMHTFLEGESRASRTYFLRRYWYGESVKEIAEACGVSEGAVKSALFRARSKLEEVLERKGVWL